MTSAKKNKMTYAIMPQKITNPIASFRIFFTRSNNPAAQVCPRKGATLMDSAKIHITIMDSILEATPKPATTIAP